MRKKSGFTLIEILIAVAVIAIIAAIAVPNMLSALQRSKRSRAMSEIKAVLNTMGKGIKKSDLTDPIEDQPLASVVDLEEYDGATKDPWGGDYLVSIDKEQGEFIIKSLGRDGVAGASSGEFDSDIVFKNGQFVAPEAIR